MYSQSQQCNVLVLALSRPQFFFFFVYSLLLFHSSTFVYRLAFLFFIDVALWLSSSIAINGVIARAGKDEKDTG